MRPKTIPPQTKTTTGFIDIDAKAFNATTYYQLFSTDALSGQTQLLATASINRQQQQVGNTLKLPPLPFNRWQQPTTV
ncbi:MAG: hypothetical protein IPI59_10220 [Sphingobacteriales bacterium]|nr:hypothetical protein [Sphingobacteriales bacterium]